MRAIFRPSCPEKCCQATHRDLLHFSEQLEDGEDNKVLGLGFNMDVYGIV